MLSVYQKLVYEKDFAEPRRQQILNVLNGGLSYDALSKLLDMLKGLVPRCEEVK